MTPIGTAQQLYKRHGLSLEADIASYLKSGYVFSTPDHLMLARAIDSNHPEQWLTDQGAADAWYVHLAVGYRGPWWCIRQMPYVLPFLCWRRDFKHASRGIRKFTTDRVLRLLEH